MIQFGNCCSIGIFNFTNVVGVVRVFTDKNGTPSKNSGGMDSQTSSPSGVNRRTAVLFTRKAAASAGKSRKTDEPGTPNSS